MITWNDLDRYFVQYLCFMFVLMRVSGVFFLAPVIGSDTVFNQVKVWVAVFVSLVFLPVIPPAHDISAHISFTAFAFISLKELSVGAALGFLMNMPFVMTRIGSEIVGRISGFGIAQVINPDVDENVSLLSEFVYIFVVLCFLSFNGHHIVFRVLSRSFEYIPIGKSLYSEKMLSAVSGLYGSVFESGVRYGAPILGLLLVIEAVFGICGKLMPEMNIMIFALPIRLTLGLIGTMLTFPILFTIIKRLTVLTERIIYAIIVSLGGGIA